MQQFQPVPHNYQKLQRLFLAEARLKRKIFWYQNPAKYIRTGWREVLYKGKYLSRQLIVSLNLPLPIRSGFRSEFQRDRLFPRLFQSSKRQWNTHRLSPDPRIWADKVILDPV